jgi:hypothetical protein
MNPEVKQKWVAALRSGNYEQGKNYLKTFNGKFCCLGVLCDILPDPGWHEVEEDDGQLGFKTGRLELAVLSDARKAEVGLSDVQTSLLMHMNDTGEDFNTIANHIEANL